MPEDIPRPLLEAIVGKRCLPFIGAGFSLNADLPPDKKMPNWDGLITELRNALNIDESDALNVAQLYEDTFGRPALIDFLVKRLHMFIARPGATHKIFSKSGFFDFIYTTNFDFLLEDSLKEENIPVMTITTPHQIPFLADPPFVNVIKMHGELPDPNVVFTKNDYANYGKTWQVIIAHLQSLLITRTPLYLGYSMRDPDFQQIREEVQEMLGKDTRKEYVLLLNGNENEEAEFRKKNLFVINRKSDTKSKSELLQDFLNEVSLYKSEQLLNNGIEVLTQKPIVIYGGILVVILRITRSIEDPIILKIFDKKNNVIYQNKIDSKEVERILKIPIEGKTWEIDSDYEIHAEYNKKVSRTTFHVSKPVSIVIQSDKSVYIRGSTIIASIINPNIINRLNSMALEVFGPDEKTCYKKAIPINPKGNGIYQEEILIDGKDWAYDPGSSFRMVVGYANQKAEIHFFTSNFGAAVVLDSRNYTWTDIVTITVVVPDRNLDPNAVDIIGTEETGKITVSTSNHVLSPYILHETGPDTGIFTGHVILTGDASLKNKEGVDGLGKNPSVKKGGIGPTDGFIPSKNLDAITVSYEFTKNQIVSASSNIRWNIGRIRWLNTSYQPNEEAVIQIVDPDMNLDPMAVDEFEIRIWSDSDQNGIKITVKETSERVGIFQGKVKFTLTDKSSANVLQVKEGDSITAQYVDRTLPPPYSPTSKIILTSTAVIGKIQPPLERVMLLNPRLVDSSDNVLTSFKIDQQIKIIADLVNNNDRDQPFTYFVQIQDSNKVTVDLMHSSGIIQPNSSNSAHQSWTPTAPGIYSVQIFVWKNVDTLSALCEPLRFRIQVK